MSDERRFRHGLVIGKFYPFHAGHQALVRAATSSCDRVTVEVMVQGVESIPASVRVGWVQGEHPDARVVAAFDDAEVDFDSPEVWDVHMAVIESHLDRPVDAVFTSDGYGQELARRLGASWVQVDPGRASTPISGTAIRNDPEANWWALPAPVRRWFTKRVVVLGAGSSGGTTLAQALGRHYGTEVVLDRRHEWTERHFGGPGGPGEPGALRRSEALDLVAHEQAAAQDLAAGRAPRPLLFCDGDVLTTALCHEQHEQHERHVGRPWPTAVAAAADRPTPALHVLTGDDLPFGQTGMHTGRPARAAMQQCLRDVLAQSTSDRGVPWIEVRGTPDQRLAAAVAAVDEVVAAGWALSAPRG